MSRCEYFERCGVPGTYECEHDANMPEDSLSASCYNEVRFNLEKAAATIDDELEALQEATRVTPELMRLEFTI